MFRDFTATHSSYKVQALIYKGGLHLALEDLCMIV